MVRKYSCGEKGNVIVLIVRHREIDTRHRRIREGTFGDTFRPVGKQEISSDKYWGAAFRETAL